MAYFWDKPERTKYLPGYLAVRAVVSSWRATLGQPLVGTQAFRFLLHATRYTAYSELLPDIRCSTDVFRDEAVRLHAEWVASLARIPRDDLEALLKSSDIELPDNIAGLGWRRGRLFFKPKQEAEAEKVEDLEFRERMRDLARDALNVLRGDHADPGRIKNAVRSTRIVAEAAAGALTTIFPDDPRFLEKAFLNRFFISLLGLPLGQADCPFYLLDELQSLVVRIRTNQKDRRNGKPNYMSKILQPGATLFAELQGAVRELGFGRMRVTRLAVLYEGSGDEVGHNFLAFQFGPWLYTERSGYLTGINLGDETRSLIASRLEKNPMIEQQQWLTGRGQSFPASRRTKEWIEANEWSIEIGGETHDISAWAHHVEELADRVSNDKVRASEDEKFVVDRIFREIFGDRLSADAVLHAFDTLRGNATDFRKLHELLKSTGVGDGSAKPEDAERVVKKLRKWGADLFETRGGIRDIAAAKS
jgi:hypothetical protein